MGDPTIQAGITVTLAIRSIDEFSVETIASTEYVAGAVPNGTTFDIVADAVAEGARTIEFCENEVTQAGTNDERSNDRGAHAVVSLFKTAIV